MKFTPIQGDFSAGELSPRLWGQVGSDGYKAGLALAANVLATQQGSFASRSGAKLISDGRIAPEASGTGTFLLPLQSGPAGYGDCMLEVEAGGTVRFKNRWGVIPWKWNQDLTSFFENNKNGNDVWTDPLVRKLYLRNYDATLGTPQRHIDIACDTAALGTTVGGRTAKLSFYHSDGLDPAVAAQVGGLVVEQWNGGAFVGTLMAAGATNDDGNCGGGGYFSVSFQPLLGTTIRFRLLQTSDGAGAVGFNQATAEVWGLRLCGDWDGGEALSMVVAGLVGSFGLRYTTFWVDSAPVNGGKGPARVFVVALTGPGMKIVMLQWNPSTALTPGWFSFLPYYDGVFADPTDSTKFICDPLLADPPWLANGSIATLIAYQGRLCLGLSDNNGRMLTTKIGYGTFFQSNGRAHLMFSPGWLESTQIALAGSTIFSFGGATVNADVVRVFKNHVEVPAAGFTITLNADQIRLPGGTVTLAVGAALNDNIAIWHYSTPPGAADALDVSLAQPTGPVAWLAELRGLMMGTQRGELVFSAGALAIDPVTGAAFSVEKHGAYGSDATLPAVNIADKVVFVLPGRKRVRLMGKSFNTFGGLLATDLSLVGEHLLVKRIRAVTFLRSPVPRLVFGFDDGTGAIATFNDEKNTLAWARFSLPVGYDIYHLSSLDAAFGSELWVTSSNGASFVIGRLESESQPSVRKRVLNSIPAHTLPADTVEVFDEGLPPVMDGWLRVPVHRGLNSYGGLPLTWVGHNVVVINPDGTYKGAYPVVWDGATPRLAFGGGGVDIDNTFLDPVSGQRRPAYYTVGLLYGDHRAKLLPREGGNPSGTAQAHMSRQPQRWLRLVDSYLPNIKGSRPPERDAAGDIMDWQANRVTGDVRYTEEGSSRASQTEIVMELPFRMEVAAIFGGASVTSL